MQMAHDSKSIDEGGWQSKENSDKNVKPLNKMNLEQLERQLELVAQYENQTSNASDE